MKKSRRIRYPAGLAGFILLFAVVIGFSACDNLNLDGTEGEGIINFHLTETQVDQQETETETEEGEDNGEQTDPADGLQEVNIEILEMRILYSTARIDTVTADSIVVDEDPNKEWIILPMDPTRINLLELTNAYTQLASAELEEGYYSEIRLILGDDNDVVDEEGEVHELMIPSGQQSGYKIKFDSRLQSGEEFDVTIEFDAEKSVRVTGNNRYMLHPVLNARKGPSS